MYLCMFWYIICVHGKFSFMMQYLLSRAITVTPTSCYLSFNSFPSSPSSFFTLLFSLVKDFSRREGFKQIDYRPESVIVLDQDIDVQALFNFLLNWRACIAAVGPQHGIPPTILSPNAFKGAALKSLKVICSPPPTLAPFQFCPTRPVVKHVKTVKSHNQMYPTFSNDIRCNLVAIFLLVN